MREIFGVLIVVLIGYYLFQEVYGEPQPIPLPEFTAPEKPKQTLPSSYNDPSYIHDKTKKYYRDHSYELKPSVRKATHSPADAPTKCGPYYLYFHPDFWKKSYPMPKIITVSGLPPDADVELLEQLWAFSGSPPYNTVRSTSTLPRERFRPVMMAEATGLHVGGHLCLPYKPLSLTCSKSSPWC